MVVEEYAKVLKAQILGCMNPNIKQLILIDDHMKLGPSVAMSNFIETCILDILMFDRM
jgi:hypothetical protein